MSIAKFPNESASQLASDWGSKIAKIARNLTDFSDSEACTRVRERTKDPATPYVGKTSELACQATDALDGLWQDYLLLSQVVDEASALAKRSSLLSNTDARVIEMLTGASIKLPAVSVPVQQRGLLDTPQKQDFVRPEDVLSSMVAAFDIAKTTVTAIYTAQSTYDAHSCEISEQLDEIKRWSENTGVRLSLPSAAVDSLAAASADPVGSLDRLGEVECKITDLHAKCAAAQAEIDALDAGLVEADAKLKLLCSAVDDAHKFYGASLDNFAGVIFVDDQYLDPAVKRIEIWLDSLRSAQAHQQFKAALIGLGNWRESCDIAIEKAHAISNRASELVAEKQDIIGRLRALRAKGKSFAGRTIVPADVLALEAAAKFETTQTPFHMAQAKASVDAYEAALADLSRNA